MKTAQTRILEGCSASRFTECFVMERDGDSPQGCFIRRGVIIVLETRTWNRPTRGAIGACPRCTDVTTGSVCFSLQGGAWVNICTRLSWKMKQATFPGRTWGNYVSTFVLEKKQNTPHRGRPREANEMHPCLLTLSGKHNIQYRTCLLDPQKWKNESSILCLYPTFYPRQVQYDSLYANWSTSVPQTRTPTNTNVYAYLRVYRPVLFYGS